MGAELHFGGQVELVGLGIDLSGHREGASILIIQLTAQGNGLVADRFRKSARLLPCDSGFISIGTI